MTEYDGYSITELVRMLGERFREYRLLAKMTQQEVAHQAGLSVATVHKFERGVATGVTLPTFLLLMKAVGCIGQLDHVFPEMPVNPYMLKDDFTKIQRIRHSKVQNSNVWDTYMQKANSQNVKGSKK